MVRLVRSPLGSADLVRLSRLGTSEEEAAELGSCSLRGPILFAEPGAKAEIVACGKSASALWASGAGR